MVDGVQNLLVVGQHQTLLSPWDRILRQVLYDCLKPAVVQSVSDRLQPSIMAEILIVHLRIPSAQNFLRALFEM